jgi:flagellar biosynthesis protein FlhF
MQLRTFSGPDLASVSFAARRALGDDAMIAHSRVVRHDGAARVEIAATTAAEVERFRALMAPSKPRLRPVGQPRMRGPGARAFVVALVGPTGAGKTTTLAKIAVNPEAFGRRRAGLLTLDTYRAGAVEQLEAYASAAGLPCESVYDPSEIDDAMRRLADCDVILVDTPGRGPRTTSDAGTWRAALRKLRPDEVHLCIPASWRLDLAAAARENFTPLGVTHALVTKLDEVPADATIASLASALDLPARWVTDGQEIPSDLRDAAPRMLNALGVAPAHVASA